MLVNIVHVTVKEPHVSSFVDATHQNHEASTRESGNLRFDVLQLKSDPCAFVLYEAWADENAAMAHKSTPHYLKWRDTVADWMEKPREGISYSGLFPTKSPAKTPKIASEITQS